MPLQSQSEPSMRICHLIDNMYLDRGGPVAVVAGLAAAQVAAGADVSIVCQAQLRFGEQMGEEHSLDAGVRLLVTGDASPANINAALSTISPDVIHVHGVWEAFHRRGTAWARSNGVPWVLSTHGMLHPSPMAKGWLKKRAYLLLLGSAVRGARRLLVTNEEERVFATRLTGRPAEVLVNGVDLSPTADVDASLFSSARPQLGHRPYLLFLGRIHPIKGLDKLVSAFAIARRSGLDADLVLAGPLDGAEVALAELACKLGIGADVHLVGALYGREKASALAGCALFVHRPNYEGFGMAVVEAMAAGRPVLTTRECGVARACPNGVMRVVPDDDATFASAMIELCATDSYASSMAANGQEWVARELSWRNIAAKLNPWYC